MVSIAPIFTKLVTNQRHFLHIHYTEIHPKWKINTSRMNRYLFTATKKYGCHTLLNVDLRFSTRKNTNVKAEQQKQTRKY